MMIGAIDIPVGFEMGYDHIQRDQDQYEQRPVKSIEQQRKEEDNA